MNIFVAGLSYNVKEEELREQFEKIGSVATVKIITDKFTGRSKGFGFVDMPDDEQAQRAIDQLNGVEMQGRALVVNKSEERKPREDNNRGGGGGGYKRRENRY
ncbi:MAG: RNA-binding protein [Bacteroidota bacterium]